MRAAPRPPSAKNDHCTNRIVSLPSTRPLVGLQQLARRRRVPLRLVGRAEQVRLQREEAEDVVAEARADREARARSSSPARPEEPDGAELTLGEEAARELGGIGEDDRARLRGDLGAGGRAAEQPRRRQRCCHQLCESSWSSMAPGSYHIIAGGWNSVGRRLVQRSSASLCSSRSSSSRTRTTYSQRMATVRSCKLTSISTSAGTTRFGGTRFRPTGLTSESVDQHARERRARRSASVPAPERIQVQLALAKSSSRTMPL